MSNWNKMDRISWKNSEVMQEFEKKIVEAAKLLADDLEKKANLESVPEDLAKVNQEAGPAADSLNEVATAVEKMYDADDGEVEEDDEEEIKEVTADIFEELKKLSRTLADANETVLAYKVERVIREIEAEKDDSE